MGNSENRTHPVGQKKPNVWGLYDVYGNVWEWCQDWLDVEEYAQYAKHLIVEDPQGPRSGTMRVIRGGSWYIPALQCASGHRVGVGPGSRLSNLGPRLARPL